MAYAEVILTEKIESLGAEADVVKVRRGYARNFLLPTGKGLEVTPSSLRKVEHLRQVRAEREARELTAAEELASKINKRTLKFELETGTQGKAFGSITAKDILDRLIADLKNVEIARHAIVLDSPIKSSGKHSIPVKLHPDVTASLSIVIKAPAAPQADEETEKESEKNSSAEA
ncbi:MAG: 50S ribosomal protein L9 [Chthoniobacterales bacterium]